MSRDQPPVFTSKSVGRVVDRMLEDSDKRRRQAEARRTGSKAITLPKVTAFGGAIDSYEPDPTETPKRAR